MTTLLAIVARDRAVVEPGEIEALAATYERLRGAGVRTEVCGPGWVRAMTIGHEHGQPAGLASADTSWVAWAGSVQHPGSLIDAPPEALDGQFVSLHFNADEDTLTLVTDPLGLKPVFLAERDRKIYISTSALVLARHLRAPPSRAEMEAFVRMGRQFGPRTHWEGVRRAEPARAMRFDLSGVTERTYWTPSPDPRMARLSLTETAEACSSRGVEWMRSALVGTDAPWCDLTGGFDSRLLALLLRRAGTQFHTNTFGDEGSEDVLIAAEVSGAAGWPWSRFDLPRDWSEILPRVLPAAVAWGDAQLNAVQLAEVLRGHGARAPLGSTVLCGGGGEYYTADAWMHELSRAGRTGEVNFDRWFNVIVLPTMDVSIFSRDPTPGVIQASRGDFQRRIEAYDGVPNVLKLDVMQAYRSRGHYGVYQAAAGGCADQRLPYLAKNLFTDAISVSSRFRRYHRLMRRMTHDLDPRIAAVRTTYGGPAAPATLRNAHQVVRYPLRRGGRLLRKVAHRASGESPSSASVVAIRRGAHRTLIEAMVRDGRLDIRRMRSGSLYDERSLSRLLESVIRGPGSSASALLGRIATIELALESADADLSA